MPNQLLENVEYKIDRTRFGTWRRYGYIDGTSYREFTSGASIFGMPLLNYTQGRNPETGSRRVAKGIIAVGQLAIGVAFGLGQLAFGTVALGQFAIAAAFGLGQFAAGYVAIGQFVLGGYGLGQFGFGKFLWTMHRTDAQAVEFFKALPLIGSLLQ